MGEPELRAMVEGVFDATFGFPLIQRIRVESGTSLDDLSLRMDARSVRNDGPLNRLLTHYHGPGDIRGNRLLLVEDAPSQYQLFGYVKDLRRVRRLPFRRSDPQRGTGLCLEDSLRMRAGDWDVARLGETQVVGMPAVQVELRPRPHFDSSYERLEATLLTAPKPALVSLAYFRDGSLLKTLFMDLETAANAEGRDYVRVRTIQGPGPLFTVLTTIEFDPLDEVRDDLFSVSNLEHFARIGEDDGRI